MDTDYQGILYFGPFTLRVNGSQVLLDLQFSVSVPSWVIKAMNTLSGRGVRRRTPMKMIHGGMRMTKGVALAGRGAGRNFWQGKILDVFRIGEPLVSVYFFGLRLIPERIVFPNK